MKENEKITTNREIRFSFICDFIDDIENNIFIENSFDRNADREKDIFINEFAKALDYGKGALFAGAGLSIPSGGISWSELLREEADKIGIDVEKENDLISVAQYIFNTTGSRQTISQLLKNKIEIDGKLNDNHKILKNFPISKVWTTNYDYYLEEAFNDANKVVDIKHSVQGMSSELNHADVTIYKMHGDIGYPHEAVFLKDDYEIYDKKNEIFIKALESDLLANTFLFIGFSFDDPNLEKILSKVRVMLEGNPRQHYCILKEVSIDDPEFRDIDKKAEALKYRKNRQRLRVEDLKRYGIKAILVKNYDEIPLLLEAVKRKYLSNKVFISGTYHFVDNFLNKNGIEANELAQKFVKKLSNRLYSEGFEITTGLGLGLGMDVITGALRDKIQQGDYTIDHRLHVHPFPQLEKRTPESETKRVWHEYRRQIMKNSGISLFLFGNKKDKKHQKIIKSNGMLDEHTIGVDYDHFRLPVVNTGDMGEEIWEEYGGKWDNYINDKKLVQRLNELTKINEMDDLINEIVLILKAYKSNPTIFNHNYEEES